MGDSMDLDLLPELSGETWVASALLEKLTVDLPTSESDIDLVAASRKDKILQTVRSWVQSGNAPPWPACAGLSPELRCWRLQVGNLTIDLVGRLWRRRSTQSEGLQLLVTVKERHELIRRFHDSLFAGHLGVTCTVFRLLDRVYWPGLRRDVRTYIASCTVCLARKSPCSRRAPMGHVEVGHRWERVAMDLLDMSVTTARGNRYVLVMVDCYCGVFIGLYFGVNTMDAPGFASPIRTYRQNLSKMRESNDPSDSEVTNLCSLGVVDLDV